MTTKFNVGDKVVIVGTVEEINVDKDCEYYTVYIVTDSSTEFLDFNHNQLFPASDITIKADDLT